VQENSRQRESKATRRQSQQKSTPQPTPEIGSTPTLRSILKHREVKQEMIQRFVMEEEGQTLVEYGLLVSLIALVVIAVLTLMGRKISNTFGAATNQLNSNTG
jgi:pilus assembly protein Flp/PilA